jgi:hypothetical protein
MYKVYSVLLILKFYSKEAMENCPVKSACHWIKQKVGETTNMIRRKLLPPKGTKFDKNLERVSGLNQHPKPLPRALETFGGLLEELMPFAV